MTSTSSSNSQAASRTYRITNLRRAHIFIEQLDRDQWPEWVQEFVDNLVGNLAQHGSLPDDAPSESFDLHLPAERQIIERCKELRPAVRRLVASVEPYWQTFSRTAVFHNLIEAEGIANCQDQLWNEPVPIVQGELAPLSVPKPDLAFGLRVHDATLLSEPSIAPSLRLNEGDLIQLQIQAAVHPFPSSGTPLLAFPSIVYECKSDTQPIFFAENQVAGAAAKAVCMQEGLLEAANVDETALPVIAFCSQGTIWKAFIAFRVKTSAVSSSIHLERLWMGDIIEQKSFVHLHIILLRVLAWIQGAYRVRVARLVAQACERVS